MPRQRFYTPCLVGLKYHQGVESVLGGAPFVASLFLVAMPGASSSVLAPSSKARSPYYDDIPGFFGFPCFETLPIIRNPLSTQVSMKPLPQGPRSKVLEEN